MFAFLHAFFNIFLKFLIHVVIAKTWGYVLQPSQKYLFADFLFQMAYTKTSNIEPTLVNGKSLRNSQLEHDMLPGNIAYWLSPCSFSSENQFALCYLGQSFRSIKTALVSCLSLFSSMLNVSRSISCLSCVGLFACLLPSGGQK